MIVIAAGAAFTAENRKAIPAETKPENILQTDSPSLPALVERGQSSAAVLSTDAKSDFRINWQVISSGGTHGGSTVFMLDGTLSQTAVGPGTSPSFMLHSGFWQDFGEGSQVCDCTPGDADGSGGHNILDVTHIINFLYKNGPAPTPYANCSGDANCDCGMNILDVTYIINYLYKDGPVPCACETWVSGCGPLSK
jgi:hypothetical protein